MLILEGFREVARFEINDVDFYCRVCGYESGDRPWGDDGHLPSFDMCPCCGVEWGYEDNGLFSTERYRNLWIEKGAPWFSRHIQSDSLSFDERMRRSPAAIP